MPVPEGNMSQMMEESEESEGYIFVGRMDNARNLTNVLKAIHFKDVSCTLVSLSVRPTRTHNSSHNTTNTNKTRK